MFAAAAPRARAVSPEPDVSSERHVLRWWQVGCSQRDAAKREDRSIGHSVGGNVDGHLLCTRLLVHA